MFSIKASILYLYHRVFFVSRRFTRILWAVGLFVGAYSGIQTVAPVIQCVPLSMVWDSHVKGHCLNVGLAATILAAFNVLTDVFILVLPMPLLWRLQMEFREKLPIIGMFLLGGLLVNFK